MENKNTSYQEYEVCSDNCHDDEMAVSHGRMMEYEVRPEDWSGAMSLTIDKDEISIAGFEVEFVQTKDLLPVELVTIRSDTVS